MRAVLANDISINTTSTILTKAASRDPASLMKLLTITALRFGEYECEKLMQNVILWTNHRHKPIQLLSISPAKALKMCLFPSIHSIQRSPSQLSSVLVPTLIGPTTALPPDRTLWGPPLPPFWQGRSRKPHWEWSPSHTQRSVLERL